MNSMEEEGVGRIVSNEMAQYQMGLARRALELVGTRYLYH